MVITENINKVRNLSEEFHKRDKVIGLVPTMGALHSGHISLIQKARKECDFLIVSIFVNSLQFGPKEDYKTYPRNYKKDKAILKKLDIDLLFIPKSKTMYLRDFSTTVNESILSKILCGKLRPTHFRGVCTIVTKLFNITSPDIVYLGQKDYQQALIIKQLVKDLNFSIKIRVLPIIREKDGLAMSSRNSYLRGEEREGAVCLYQALSYAKRSIKGRIRDPRKVINGMKKIVSAKKNVKIDYIDILSADNLSKVKEVRGKIVIALAVYIRKTRLIDNLIIYVKK